MEAALAISFGYIVGSVPFAFLLARRRGVDLRFAGSGNVGAANVLRTTSVAFGVTAMVLDALKGSLAVITVQAIAAGRDSAVVAGLAAIVGHVYPVWLGFRGGKGVATAAGVFLVLAPAALTVAAAMFVTATWASQYVSVGSLAASLALVATVIVIDEPRSIALAAAITAAIVVHRHRGNIGRLLAGTERRIGQRLS